MKTNKTQKTIPDGWTPVKLGDIAKISRGGSPRPIEVFITKEEDGYNWLRIGDIDPNSKYIYSTSEKIKKEGLSKTTLVKSDDFILSNSMSFGRPYIMKTTACIHDGWLALKDISPSTHKDYLFYLLSSKRIQNLFISLAAGSGVQNLKKETVSLAQVDLPKLEEQNRIVAVLETWDKAIEKLEKKIEIKKKVKIGLMNQLLTGSVRLSGFLEKWQEYKLGEITTLLKDGTHGTHKNVLGGIPLLSAKDLVNGSVSFENNPRLISKEDFQQIHKNYSIKNGDILLTLVGTIGRVAVVENYKNNFTFQRSVGILRFEKGETNFFYHLFNTAYFQEKLSIIQNKGAQGGVYLGNLSKIKVSIPTYSEQKAIASIFITADSEINQLKKKLPILKEQKKYLLNNLITGAIRTPENLKIS